MAIRIRVYPSNGLGAYGGVNRFGGAVSAQTFYNQKLSAQRQISNLQLQYERALWSQKLDTVRLEERLKNPYAMYGAGMVQPYGVNPYAGALGGSMLGGMGGSFFGGLGLGRFF